VHIVGRNDIAEAQVDDYSDRRRVALYDDGTHGDPVPGDNVFVASGVQIPCDPRSSFSGVLPFGNWLGYLRVTLKDGTVLAYKPSISNPFVDIGLVDPRFKNVFQVKDLGNGLSATAYAFFIQDTSHQIYDAYPVSNLDKISPQNAAHKMYSVMPDAFDFILVSSGETIINASNLLASAIGYEFAVSNSVRNIGIRQFDDSTKYGSAGKLKSVLWSSFGFWSDANHEIAHAWGVNLERSLGLHGDCCHWNPLSDVGGQLVLGFSQDGNVGLLQNNGDNIWRLDQRETYARQYSPLELYLMGLIPPNQVPPVHVLTNPNASNPQRITAATVRTLTIDDIIKAQGGARDPSVATSQKEFKMALVVTDDSPYNDPAYALFSLLSLWNASREEPPKTLSFPQLVPPPFYWATGGRATLNMRLPVDVPDVPASVFKP
jgi:hypothetical protein